MPAVLEPSQTLAFVESLTPKAVDAHYFGSLLRELAQGAKRRPELEPARAALHRLVLRAVDQLQGDASLTPLSRVALSAINSNPMRERQGASRFTAPAMPESR